MSKRSELVEYIKKYAQNIPTRSRGPKDPSGAVRGGQIAGNVGTPTPARHGQVPSTGVSSSGPQIMTVMKMQEELQKLANSVIAETASTQTAGRGSFSDFITKHYAKHSDVAPVEFNQNSKDTGMNTVMEAMHRIGGRHSELKIDGKWGPKTNAALRNVYALAFSLIKMAADFKFTPQSYNSANLAQLKPMIPEEAIDLSDPDKEQYAHEITRHIKGIEKLFQEVKNRILQNPEYQSYIEGEGAFATYKKSTPSQLTPEQIQSIKQSFPQGFIIPIDQKGDRTAQFTVDNIISLDVLNKTIASIDQANQVKLDPYNVLTLISNQIGRQIRSN